MLFSNDFMTLQEISLFSHCLNLGILWDLLWPTEWGGWGTLPVPSLGQKSLDASIHSLGTLLSHHPDEFRLACRRMKCHSSELSLHLTQKLTSNSWVGLACIIRNRFRSAELPSRPTDIRTLLVLLCEVLLCEASAFWVVYYTAKSNWYMRQELLLFIAKFLLSFSSRGGEGSRMFLTVLRFWIPRSAVPNQMNGSPCTFMSLPVTISTALGS